MFLGKLLPVAFQLFVVSASAQLKVKHKLLSNALLQCSFVDWIHCFLCQFKRVCCFIVLQLFVMLCLEYPYYVLNDMHPKRFIVTTFFTCTIAFAITLFAVIIIAAFALAFVDAVTALVTAIVATVVVLEIIDVALLRLTAVVTHVCVCFVVFI